MAEDRFLPTGALKSTKPEAGNANIRSVPVFGLVKDNIDPTRSGRLRVYISDFSGLDPNDADSWTTVSYMTPFYGYVNPTAPETNDSKSFGDYVANPSSYGMWNSPPDIGSTVICIFVNGDMNYGFWIGCVPKPEALTMVPSVGGSENVLLTPGESDRYGGATILPVTNMNTNNEGISDKADFFDQPKPVHSWTAMTMFQQGILKDPLRGPISTTAQRETPSRVGWGVSTPGRPIFQDGATDNTIGPEVEQGKTPAVNLTVVARRGGHSIVMDDGNLVGQDQLIRIRTAMGHQILMSDDGQTLMILHSNGKSYIELGKEGTIDMFSTNSINLRSQGDINLHADNCINLNADKNVMVKGKNIKVEAERTFAQKTGVLFKQETTGVHSIKSIGTLMLQSTGPMSLRSASLMYLNALKIGLNSGAFGLPAPPVNAITTHNLTDTLLDESKGFIAAPGKLKTITSRAPAHCPWAAAGEGADLTSSDEADFGFPASPSAALSALNSAAGLSNALTPSLATLSSIPGVNAVSDAINAGTSESIIGTIATDARGVANAITSTIDPSGVVVQNGTALVGTLAQTPREMMTSGVLKPGSDQLVDSLIRSGKLTPQEAFAPCLFEGKPGAENLQSFVNNLPCQVSSQLSNLQIAQNGLMTAGLLSGRESGNAISGVVLAAAKQGVNQVLSAAKTGGVSGGISKWIAVGNYAANIAETVSGGMGPVVNAAQLTQQITRNVLGLGASNLLPGADRGAAYAAFKAISMSLPKLPQLTPVNLKSFNAAALNARISAEAASVGTDIAGNKISNVSKSSYSGILNIGGIAVKSAQIASGVSNIPGGQLAFNTGMTGGNPLIDAKILNNPNMNYLGYLGKAADYVASGKVGSLGQALQLPEFNLNAAAANKLSSAFNGLINGTTSSLSNLALSGLGASSKGILSAITGSLSSIGVFPGRMASFGIDTLIGLGNAFTNNLSMSVIKQLFYDPRVPLPDYSGTQDQDDIIMDQIDQILDNIEMETEIAKIYRQEADQAKEAYYSAINTYDDGDSNIKSAEADWISKEQKWVKQLEKIELLRQMAG